MTAIGGRCMATTLSAPPKRKTVLLRSSWQVVNIGDVGHTPGALQIIHDYCPDTRVILWPSPNGLDGGVEEFLRRSFPQLEFARGVVVEGRPSTPELRSAWEAADFLVHSSGSGFPARNDVAAWRNGTGKPYGVFPVSTDPVSGLGPDQLAEGGTLSELRAASLERAPKALSSGMRETIDGASFMFCRDSVSLSYLQHEAVRPPILALGPDTQFGMIQRDDEWGRHFMRTHELEPNSYICLIPRLRYTMYTTDKPQDGTRSSINQEHLSHDMELFRVLIHRYVRETGKKVLLCPEMTYQIQLGKKEILDRLPKEIARSVVWKSDFWLPNQAAAVYAHAQAVISMECHSPIISLVQGTPTLYVRQPTDTCKGQMYPDFGLADWLLEIDHISDASLWSSVQSILGNRTKAHERATAAMQLVHKKQAVMGTALHDALVAMGARTR